MAQSTGKKKTRDATARAHVAAAQAEAKRKERRGKLIFRSVLGVFIAGGAAAVAIVVIVAQNNSQNAGKIAGVVSYSNLSRNHVTTPVTYPQVPPVGGNHAPVWLNCGIYNAPVHNENAVHAMEHGAVWITYQPGTSAADIALLKADVNGKAYTVLSPYPGQPAPVTATAWGKQLNVDSASDPRIAKFISVYMQGPQTPEPGAACTGGTGTPTG